MNDLYRIKCKNQHLKDTWHEWTCLECGEMGDYAEIRTGIHAEGIDCCPICRSEVTCVEDIEDNNNKEK